MCLVLALPLSATVEQSSPALAETTITAQARADGGAFLPYAPAPAQPVGLCLVDTGVSLNPDTESAVLDREAIDHGAGDDVSLDAHGTLLAMMAAAPVNGWGMTGAAPGAVRIVSVRVLEAGQTTFPFSSYAAGIDTCVSLSSAHHLRVINLSLGGSEPTSGEERERLQAAIERASDYGINVVAAAGNDGGNRDYPAAFPTVMSVGASDAVAGGLCSFSNEDSSLDLLAPGCELDGADPATGAPEANYWQGTSESSVIAAAALAALEAYRPDLSASAAEGLLTGSDSGTLNIAHAFLNAGLGPIVAAGEAGAVAATPVQKPENSPQSVRTSNSMEPTPRFNRPHARLRRIGRRLLLVIAGRLTEAIAQIRMLARRGKAHRQRVIRVIESRLASVQLPRGLSAVSVRYIDGYDAARSSTWQTLAVPSHRSARR
jgi:Subtilase family